LDGHVAVDLGVEANANLETAQVLDGLADFNLAAVDLMALGGQGGGNVTRGDRAKELAAVIGAKFEGELDAIDARLLALGLGTLVGDLSFDLLATALHQRQVGASGFLCKAAGSEEIPEVAGLDVDDFPGLA